ncbi:MAG: serine protein kinase RIO, partial [Thermoprotei archaeon]
MYVIDFIEARLPRKVMKKLKDSRLFEVTEEVFDYPTLMALYDLINRGIIHIVHGVVAAGKEARIYWGENRKGEDLAIKIYLVTTAEFRKGRLKYIEGDPRFSRVPRKIRDLVKVWVAKEFKNIQVAWRVGIPAPRVYGFKDNVLVMEFLSFNRRGVPAPSIKNYPPDDPQEAFNLIKNFIRILFLKGKLVHADLSEYNILNTGDKLY